MKRLDSYTCYFVNENDRAEQFPNKDEAMKRAAAHVGNWSFTKPTMQDEVYLFGPGDGTTSVLVRQDVEFER